MKYVYNGKTVKRLYVRVNTQSNKYKFISFLPNINRNRAKKFLDIVSNKDIKKIAVYLQDVKVKDGSHTYKSVETMKNISLKELKYTLAYFICDRDHTLKTIDI